MRAFNGICFINKREAQALLTYASKDISRPISAIYFDGPRNQVAATNGHQMAICKATQGQLTFTSTLPRAALESAVRALPKGSLVAITQTHIGHIAEVFSSDVVDPSNVAEPVPYDQGERYPDYMAVVRAGAKNGCRTQGFSACYLADLNTIARAAEYKREEGHGSRKRTVIVSPAIELRLGDDELSPAYWTCKSVVSEWFGLLMPVRL